MHDFDRIHSWALLTTILQTSPTTCTQYSLLLVTWPCFLLINCQSVSCASADKSALQCLSSNDREIGFLYKDIKAIDPIIDYSNHRSHTKIRALVIQPLHQSFRVAGQLNILCIGSEWSCCP